MAGDDDIRTAEDMAYPFRIERPARIRATGADGQAADAGLAGYMDRLIKLIPAEILALYLTIRGFWAGNPPEPATPGGADAAPDPFGEAFLGWWPIICVGLLLTLRVWGTRDSGGSIGSVQWGAVGIAAFSFIVWVYAMGHHVLGLALPDARLAPTVVVLWVFIVPLFYRGQI